MVLQSDASRQSASAAIALESQIMGFHHEEVQSPGNAFIKEMTGEPLLPATSNEGQT
jgi:hypothetical protein